MFHASLLTTDKDNVNNKLAMNFWRFKTKSVISFCDGKGFMQSCSQISYSSLYLGLARLPYFQPMFHLWRNHLIDLHQQKCAETHLEEWHLKDMWVIDLNLKYHISIGVFHTICQCKTTISFSKIETLVPNRLRDKTVLKYCIISATRRKGRIKMHVH